MANGGEPLLDALDAARRKRPGAAEVERLLGAVDVAALDDPLAVARLHDLLLFLRAFPHSRRVAEESGRLLGAIPARVAGLAASGGDLSPLDGYETSGIGGTAIEMGFSWGMARWLARERAGAVSLSWEGEEATDRLAAALPRFLPFLAEAAAVDSGVAFRRWLEAALPDGTVDGGLRFLVDAVDALDRPDEEKGELWDGLGFLVRWELGESADSRTLARLPFSEPFVDDAPLVPRGAVSVAAEMAGALARPRCLGTRDGRAFLEAALSAVAVRYRELHAFTWGNPADVHAAPLGRGLAVVACGVDPRRRLPLRAGYGFLVVRNGVPIGYGDAYALGERLDLAFNVFYAFRDGESAWTYARTVAFFRALLGTRVVAVDPYQIGSHNEEAVSSGAFWFYRKLGFRSCDPAVEALALREEARNAARRGRRTSPAVLRRLAESPVVLDGPGSVPGAWDRYRTEAAGLAVQRARAASGLSPDAFRRGAARQVGRALGATGLAAGAAAVPALGELATLLSLVPGLSGLPARDRAAALALLRGKLAPSEAPSVRRLARGGRLVEALRSLGSGETCPARTWRSRLTVREVGQ